ncbi:hypothetical protein [Larkinella ripae]
MSVAFLFFQRIFHIIPANAFLVTLEGPRIVVVQPNGVRHFQSITLNRDFETTLWVLSGLQGRDRS